MNLTRRQLLAVIFSAPFMRAADQGPFQGEIRGFVHHHRALTHGEIAEVMRA